MPDDPRGADGPDHSLEALGLTPRVRALFAEHADAGLLLGRVLRVDRGSALVATADGVVRAEHSARLRKEALSADELPAVGDWLGLRIAPGHDRALVEAVVPRASAFMRGDPGKGASGQVVAANIDVVFVVQPLAEAPNLRRIERELALAWDSGATPVVVLSKSDLAEDAEAACAAVREVAPEVDVVAASVPAAVGLDRLLSYADGHRTVALIGPSGSGKSTIVNALLGEERQQTAEVRLADGKGRHTTVVRELIPLPNGGMLVDTPGMRAVGVWDLDEGIDVAFADIAALAPKCRFRDCEHADEPGCAVRAAVEAGDLPAGRLESYHKLAKEARSAAIRADARLRAEEERRWGRAMHQYKQKYGKR